MDEPREVEKIQRPTVRLDRDPQLALFDRVEVDLSAGDNAGPERPLSAKFEDPDPEAIYLGKTPLREHLKRSGTRDALVLREMLSTLDFAVFEGRYKAGGRPAFSPRSMVGIVLYGVMRGVSSLRELERFARMDLGCMWVSGGNMPDHSVLGRFITRHGEDLSQDLFQRLVTAVLKRTGSTRQSVAGDGTVIEAMCSRYGELSREAAVEERDALAAEHDDDAKRQVRQAQLTTMIETLDERHQAAGNRGHHRLNPQEPDASVLKLKNERGYASAYVPVVLSNAARVVIDAAVHGSQEAAPMEALLSRQPAEVQELLLDAGFRSTSLVEAAWDKGMTVWMPTKEPETPPERFAQSAFIYDGDKDIYTCPAGQTLVRLTTYRHAGKGRKKGKATAQRTRYGTTACGDCSLRSQCTSSTQRRRLIERTDATVMREKLSTTMSLPDWQARYRHRQAWVEPVFSALRGIQGLNRFRRRGLDKVSVEFLLHVMAYNVRRAVVAFLRTYARFKRVLRPLEAVMSRRLQLFRANKFLICRLNRSSTSRLRRCSVN